MPLQPRSEHGEPLPFIMVAYAPDESIGAEIESARIARATVANFLISQGINPNIVSAKGVGDTRPVASNDTPQGRAQNRRIEITVQGPGA